MRNAMAHANPRTLSHGARTVVAWVALITGFLLLTLALGLRADGEELSAHASRTSDFNASGTIRSLALENVNGDVVVTAGKSFSANVTVNVNVSSAGIAGEQRLGTVNGNVSLAGARRDVRLNTVNGNIEGTLADLPKGADVKAETVNGNIVLRLPARAGFEFSGRTMSGEILSTFPLPESELGRSSDELEREKERVMAEKERARAERSRL